MSTKSEYQLTSTLLKNITEIERLYGQLEGMDIPQSLLLNLEKTNLITSAFSSNSIEGNPLSFVEVTNLILDEKIPINRDEQEVRNYFDIIKDLDQNIQHKINQKLTLDFHEKLLDKVNDKIKGKFRNSIVVVGHKDLTGKIVVKHNPPVHTEKDIKNSMVELFKWLKKSELPAIVKAGLFHHQFVHIHPFVDGNGRVCRLLTALLLLKHKYLINKYFILDDYYEIDKTLYSDKLHSADKGDKTEWLEYFTDGVKYSLNEAKSKIEKGLSRLSFETRPTVREKEALYIVQRHREVSSTDIAKEMNVTRQQSFNLLKSLVQKGLLQQKGQGKSSYYTL